MNLVRENVRLVALVSDMLPSISFTFISALDLHDMQKHELSSVLWEDVFVTYLDPMVAIW